MPIAAASSNLCFLTKCIKLCTNVTAIELDLTARQSTSDEPHDAKVYLSYIFIELLLRHLSVYCTMTDRNTLDPSPSSD